jgi:hypothetical protein
MSGHASGGVLATNTEFQRLQAMLMVIVALSLSFPKNRNPAVQSNCRSPG